MSRDNLAKVRAKLALTYARATLLKTQEFLQMARKVRSQEQKQTRAYRLHKELRLLKSILLADPDCPVPGHSSRPLWRSVRPAAANGRRAPGQDPEVSPSSEADPVPR